MRKKLLKLFTILFVLLTACNNRYILTLDQLKEEIKHVNDVNYYTVLNDSYTLSLNEQTSGNYSTYITFNYNGGYLYIDYSVEDNNTYGYQYLFYSDDKFAFTFFTHSNGTKTYKKYSAKNALEANEISKENIRNFFSVFGKSVEFNVNNVINDFSDDINNKAQINLNSFRENGYLFVDYNYVTESTNIKFAYKKSISFDTHYRLSKFQYGFKNVTNNEILNESEILYLYSLDMTYTANYDFKNVNMNEYEEGDIFYYPASSEEPH